MMETLPIRLLRDEDANIYGSLNVLLGKLARLGFPVSKGIALTPPEFQLQTILERFDFGSIEIFEQNLSLVKKEIEKTRVPGILIKETKSHNKFLLSSQGSQAAPGSVGSVKQFWITLLHGWLEEIKRRLWKDGFYQGITEGLQPQVVIFVNKAEAFGAAYFDPIEDRVVINIQKGKLEPVNQKKLAEIVETANKKLLIPHEYEWILDKGLKLTGVRPYTPPLAITTSSVIPATGIQSINEPKSTVKVFLDLSKGLVIERAVDGIYISSEKIFDLNKPQSSWEELVFKLVESATTFPESPILVKLADMSEGMGKVRGALRLIHQKSLIDPLTEAVLFCRNKKELRNIHIVIPFVRGVNELIQIKRDLAVKKLTRKSILEIWLELAVPENIVNLEDYLIQGVDGVVLNLDELSSHFAGYDHTSQDMAFYKHEVAGLLKFLEDGIKLLHKSKIPFIAYGSLSLNPTVLDFLVEKGIYGLVVERYEASAMVDLLHSAEKRLILRRTI